MVSSDVDICNSALAKVGEEPIQSLDDDNKRARLCKNQYPIKRDELIRSHPWNFAIQRREFAADVTAPLYEYDFSYIIPTDVFRILTVNDENVDAWFKEGKRVVTNLTPFKCRCLVQVTDVSFFDENFVEALALLLASDLAYAIAQSTKLKRDLFEESQFYVRQARSFDAQEGSVQQVIADQWVKVRF